MREIHPLCCISIDCSGAATDRSPPPEEIPRGQEAAATAVAGVLYKWTNYSKGWRCRWFRLRNGVLSYSKSPFPSGDEETRIIGDPSTARLQPIDGCGRRRPMKHAGVVHLKISSFRESMSDERRFYIFSFKKTLYLKTDSRDDRTLWIAALTSTRSAYPLRSVSELAVFNEISFSTEKLRNRLLEEGLNETLINDCEQIMLSQFSQLKKLYSGHLSFLGQDAGVDPDTAGTHHEQLLVNSGFSSFGHGKYSEYSTTESSEDAERQDLDELSEEEELCYFDAHDSFGNIIVDRVSAIGDTDSNNNLQIGTYGLKMPHTEIEAGRLILPHADRRKKLPDPIEKEKGVSLWSMIKDNVGKDLTHVCLPVYFNEPLSSLQRCFEDLEYSSLLDKAYEYGKMGNNLMRILNVAAFAVSGYASTEGRSCKPFNPLLGETYEADYPEKGIRFFSEKASSMQLISKFVIPGDRVSHHPMLIACHCEGRGWKFWGDSNLKSKFWGTSIQLDPVGVLTLEFDDGEVFQWSKVTTNIYNLILGKIYCDHHGVMQIQGNRELSCKVKFKEQSLFDRSPHEVEGYVEDVNRTRVASIMGKWSNSLYYVEGDLPTTTKCSKSLLQSASLLWEKNKYPSSVTRYNLSPLAITLNELTPDLQEKLPPTDSRCRPDQRHLENGEYERANAEKIRLEKRQRMSRKMQENGWKPRWFQREGKHGTYRYVGGYWEAREEKNWDGCPDIFGAISEDLSISSSN